MRAPVEHVVARHLLTHPEDSPTELARHCRIHVSSASRALKRLREKADLPSQLLHHLVASRSRPPSKAFHFQAPNPDHFLRQVKSQVWLTGEAAAASEGFDLVPSRIDVYVPAEDLQEALRAAKRAFAKVTDGRQANLTIRVADPWLYLDPSDPLVEKGQRWLDYLESRNVQLAREMQRLA